MGRERLTALGRVALLAAALSMGTAAHPPEGALAGRAVGPDGSAFVDTFDGSPERPAPFRSPHWDVTLFSHDPSLLYAPLHTHAGHGDDCAPPPATHRVSSAEEAIFQCRDHVMTAVDASMEFSPYHGMYAAAVLTPDHLLDFSRGEARLSFDLSTERAARFDWVDVWLSPYDEHHQAPGTDGRRPVANYLPGAHWLTVSLTQDARGGRFRVSQRAPYHQYRDGFGGGPLPVADATSYADVLEPSAARRDTFELRISRTHIKVGMPAYDLWWVDTEMDDLGWDRAVVQLGHHFAPLDPSVCPGGRPQPACAANTWHWDNVALEPAVPFTILPADRAQVDQSAPAGVRFERPAPANAHLRFLAAGAPIEVSVDGGETWVPARTRFDFPRQPGLLAYWTPLPAGVTSVQLRGQEWGFANGPEGERYGWVARSISVWAPPEAQS
ncbi:MAG TPA: hypothetical protein VFX49_01510 [Chloroflexota bacterium]|nr:hypothetical protein [Chloroflexota bacterium]